MTLPTAVGTGALLSSEAELEAFMTSWWNGALPRSHWSHAAHVMVAAYYAFDHDAEQTLALVKAGILRYAEVVGIVQTPDSGYHETLTRLWATVVRNFLASRAWSTRWEAVNAAVTAFAGDRSLPQRYYSFDVARDRRARREWVEPDLMSL